MKTSARPPYPFAAFVFFLALTLAVCGQEKPTPAAADQPSVAPAPATAPATPAAATVPAAAPAEEPPPTPAPAVESDKPELRRLDTPPADEAQAADEAEDKSAETMSPDNSEKAAPAAPAAAPAKPEKPGHGRYVGKISSPRHNGNERVSFWNDSTLAEGEYADAVVSIFGSSTSDGHVGDAVVSVLGSSTSSGEVGNAVVSVLGSTRVTGGVVGDAAVAVLGNNYVNAHIKGDVVAVLGEVELGPKAVVDGNVVCVGGTAVRDPKAVVHGQINNVAIGGHFGGGNFNWLHAWVSQCLFYGRPLAFGPNLMWAWWIAIGALALYVVIALLFPRGVERCAETLEQRPGYSILSAFLTTLLAPLATILLIITIVGAPALIVCLFVAGIFGKVVMLAWIGRLLTKRAADGRFAAPAIAVLIGGVIVLGLYTVPILGFVLAKLISWLGLGVVVYTLILGMKRNKAAARAAAMAAVPPMPPPPPVAPAASVETAGLVADPLTPGLQNPSPAAGNPAPASVPVTAAAPVRVPAASLLRAGFWIRLAASALDAVLVAVAIHLLPRILQPNYMLAFAAYCVVLWVLKGTTVGGIVCGLKVVRLDDRPLDWATALVRALGGFLSFIVAGLGFIWVAFDDQKQSWHDKIAGTTVVQVPKGVSLL